MRGVAGEFDDAVIFGTVDIENPANRSLIVRYGASSIPSVVILDRNGDISSIWHGLTGADQLRFAVGKALEAS